MASASVRDCAIGDSLWQFGTLLEPAVAPPNYFLDLSILDEGDCVFRESAENGPGWSLYRNPIRIAIAKHPVGVEQLIQRADEFAKSGGHVAIAIAYDAAPAFDSAFVAQRVEGDWFAWAAYFDHPPERFRELAPVYEAPLELDQPTWDFETYRIAFEQVKTALGRGDSYQVNLTFPQKFELRCSAAEFFANRCGVDPPPFASFWEMGAAALASFSPELLYERTGDRIRTRPMKGTAPAPPNRRELAGAIEELSSDPKTRAENVMIVDMARNDLGAICEFGSVETTSLLNVEKHRNLLQVTSTVEGTTSSSLWETLKALFPAASVTGAPKVQTMRIISELESRARGAYCGALGLLKPNHQRFAVAIRTASIDNSSGQGQFGIGSGVVWDSKVEDEYAECLAKRDRLLQSGEQWALRDAIAVDRIEDPARLDQHLDRLADNARFFDIPIERTAIAANLREHGKEPTVGREKVRIRIARDGKWETARLPSVVESDVMRIAIADEPMNSKDINLTRKTSSRAMLDDARDRSPDVDDVLLYNELGHLTEFGYANVVVEHKGRKFTPFVEDGCLAGIGVLEMIERGEVERAHIPLAWLHEGAEIWYVNSVAGMVRAEISSTKPRKSSEFSYSES